MIRLFVAVKIEPQESLMKAFNHVKTRLSDARISWVNPQNLHITLKFLGDTPDKNVEKVKEQLRAATQGAKPFTLEIRGLGSFGNTSNPRVLWMGIFDDRHRLEKLYRSVQEQLEPLGYENEGYFFRPHLTLGRIREMKDTIVLRELESSFGMILFQRNTIDSFALYKSQLTPQGPVYTMLEKYSFKK